LIDAGGIPEQVAHHINGTLVADPHVIAILASRNGIESAIGLQYGLYPYVGDLPTAGSFLVFIVAAKKGLLLHDKFELVSTEGVYLTSQGPSIQSVCFGVGLGKVANE
jgi:hypothetical protein